MTAMYSEGGSSRWWKAMAAVFLLLLIGTCVEYSTEVSYVSDAHTKTPYKYSGQNLTWWNSDPQDYYMSRPAGVRGGGGVLARKEGDYSRDYPTSFSVERPKWCDQYVNLPEHLLKQCDRRVRETMLDYLRHAHLAGTEHEWMLEKRMHRLVSEKWTDGTPVGFWSDSASEFKHFITADVVDMNKNIMMWWDEQDDHWAMWLKFRKRSINDLPPRRLNPRRAAASLSASTSRRR